jgi:predicted nucleic acid-binding protein
MATASGSERLFLDTGYAIARFNHRDEYHQAAKSFGTTVAACLELWTTDAVLLEIAASFSRPEHRAIAIGLWDQFHAHDSRFRVAAADDEGLSTAMDLYKARYDKSWSLTDCLSFVVMEREGLTQALTAERHIEQAGFTALLVS